LLHTNKVENGLFSQRAKFEGQALFAAEYKKISSFINTMRIEWEEGGKNLMPTKGGKREIAVRKHRPLDGTRSTTSQ